MAVSMIDGVSSVDDETYDVVLVQSVIVQEADIVNK